MQIESEQNSTILKRSKPELSFITAFALAVLLLSSSAGICETNEDKARAHAHQLVKDGHSYEGCKILLEICRKHPKDANLLLELGETHLHDESEMLNGPLKAEQYFRKALKIDPELGKAYCMLAEWARIQCKYDLAIQMATKAVTVKKPDILAYLERATSYSTQHKDKEALADLNKFIALAKTQGKTQAKIQEATLRKAYEQRAALLEKLQLYERALADYRYLQKEHFYDPTALKEAYCLEKLNRSDEAMTCLNSLLKLNPEDETALETRGRIWAKQGRYKEAIADYSKSIQLIPSATLYRQRADVYEKMGRKDLAARDRKEAEHF